MDLASITNQYYDRFMAKHGDTALPGHLKAMDDIRNCRTPDSGEVYTQCYSCNHGDWQPLSCGNRSCPRCQNHDVSQWIDRQTDKLLPVLYFMLTFTLPFQLRSLTRQHQRQVFSIFFHCVSSTLRDFGLNPNNMGAQIGMTMVLHTHSRRLDFHPHIHVVVPGGGVDTGRHQ
ncbi:MAG: transposase [Desulfobacterales bacterium]|nr:transposase [Desulfobacterales bacterium]